MEVNVEHSNLSAQDTAGKDGYTSVQEELIMNCLRSRLGKNENQWLDIITPLVSKVSQLIEPDDDMNPKKCLKILGVTSGDQKESTLVEGIILQKSVAHKQLPSEYAKPNIMIVLGSLEIEDQLASIDSVMQHDNQVKERIIKHLHNLRPNIILVEGNVSWQLKSFLLDQKITWVTNVRRSSLQRIAKCTEALMQERNGTPVLVDQCDRYKADSATGLIHFKASGGYTLLLRGCPIENLKELKEAIKAIVFEIYQRRMVTAFLADEASSLHSISDEASEQQVTISENLAKDHFSGADYDSNLLVYYSSYCRSNRRRCGCSALLIKFQEHKSLGAYLRENFFSASGKKTICGTCNNLMHRHTYYYIHQSGKLEIKVLFSLKELPGEQDGKIWLWYECQTCDKAKVTDKVLLSTDSLRLSFGRFLELYFSNSATRVALCGHSIQSDHLQYIGCGSRILVSKLSSIDILTVHLPLSVSHKPSTSTMVTDIDMVVPVYEHDPGSAISYALYSKDYKDWMAGSRPVGEFEHFGMSFSDVEGKLEFYVGCFFAAEFEKLRKDCLPNEVNFLNSLKSCEKWNAQGGKSGAFFAKSEDKRFIIKEIVPVEVRFFKKFSNDYFKYFAESGHSTCIVKVLGMFQVSMKHLKGNQKINKYYIVMPNLFYNRSICRSYDVKGSERSRYVSNTASGSIGQDKNLLENAGGSIGQDTNLIEDDFIVIEREAKRKLERAIRNDTSFLSAANIMDYSLLVGVDKQCNQLVVGIIDYLRAYTCCKKLESLVKKSGILGGPANVPPTIIAPDPYKVRFRKAMSRYFISLD